MPGIVSRFVIIVVGICFFILAGSGLDVCVQKEGNAMPPKTLEEVLKRYTDELMQVQGVVGTAQGLCDNKPCIKIFVIQRTKNLEEKLPKSLDGFPVEIEETGEIRALPERNK
jgi:hypothetical protein